MHPNIKHFMKNALGYLCPQLTKTGQRTLMYHAVGSRLVKDPYGLSISKERFQEHMTYLAALKRCVPLDPSLWQSTPALPNPLSVTFDDGFQDNVDAAEICVGLNLPFTIFVTTGFTGQKGYLNVAELKALAQSPLCTLGAHGHTHTRMTRLSWKALYRELKDSKERLEDITGRAVKHMSYPHGAFHPRVIQCVQQAGYETAWCSIIGWNSLTQSDRLSLKRTEILGSDGILDITKKLNGHYDYLGWFTKQWQTTQDVKEIPLEFA